MNGKGDTPRPLSVSPAEYASNYERTFAKRTAEVRELERIAEVTNQLVSPKLSPPQDSTSSDSP